MALEVVGSSPISHPIKDLRCGKSFFCFSSNETAFCKEWFRNIRCGHCSKRRVIWLGRAYGLALPKILLSVCRRNLKMFSFILDWLPKNSIMVVEKDLR